jgi:cardiolipin synthase
VRIYEYRPTAMHAKTFVVDGALTAVTTMNFDNRSLAYNNEVALVARDGTIGAGMEAMFLDDLQMSDEIRLEVFGTRTLSQRFIEYGASVLANLL